MSNIYSNNKDKIRYYCTHNAKNIDYDDKSQIYYYEYFSRAILNELSKKGKLSSDDLKAFIYYIVGRKIHSNAKRLIFPYNITFDILPDKQYINKLPKSKEPSKAITDSNVEGSKIYIRESVIDDAIKRGSFNADGLYKAIHNSFHEVSHAYTHYLVFHRNNLPSKELLIIIKEYIVCAVYSDYNKKNYSGLLSEKIADYDGVIDAEEIISDYFKEIYPLLTDKFRDDLSDNKYLYDNPQHRNPKVNYEHSRNARELLDSLIEEIARNKWFPVYPMLKIEYNPDYTRKTYRELSNDYWTTMQKGKSRYKNGKYTEKQCKAYEDSVEDIYSYLLMTSPTNPEYQPFSGSTVFDLRGERGEDFRRTI